MNSVTRYHYYIVFMGMTEQFSLVSHILLILLNEGKVLLMLQFSSLKKHKFHKLQQLKWQKKSQELTDS